MGGDYQEPTAPAIDTRPTIQQGNVSPDPNLARDREIAQLRAEVNHYRQEVARYRQRATRAATYTYAQQKERGGCLTAWPVFQSVCVALIAILGFVALSHEAPARLTFPLFILFASLVFVAISIIGLWNLKKWGYYMQMTGYTISLVFGILSLCSSSSAFYYDRGTILTTSISGLVVTVLYMLILYLLVHNRWEMFE